MARILSLPWLLTTSIGRLLAFLTVLPPGAGRVRRALCHWLRGVSWLLQFEPSWFAEFGLATGAVGWGVGALLTDDLLIRGWAYGLPIAAVIGGGVRCWALLKLSYSWRAVLGGLSAALWAWLAIGLTTRYGFLPFPGLLMGIFIIEMLTAMKFSLPCARELRDEFMTSDLHHAG